MKKFLFIFFSLFSFLLANAQEKNYHTTLGLGIGSSLPMGSFKSKDIYNKNSGFANNEYDGFQFLVQQNIGKQFGLSLNFYSVYHKFDIESYERALNINKRGIAPYDDLIYEIKDTTTEWNVNITSLGAYYYKYLGAKKRILMNINFSAVITDMYSPKYVVKIKDSSNNIIQTLDFDSHLNWREVFLFPPIDGFSIGVNARYFFTKHISVNTSLYYINSIAYYNGKNKALIDLSEVDYQVINIFLSINYTILYKYMQD